MNLVNAFLFKFCQQKWILILLFNIDYLTTFLLDIDNCDSYDDVYPVQRLLAQECPLTCIRLLSLTNTKHFSYINTINTTILYIQLAKSSRAIQWGAIFSALSWSKSHPITVLGSCYIPKCYSKVFFAQLYFFCCCLLTAPTQWGLLTVFAQIDKKWISRQCISSFLWPFMSALWSVPPKRSKQWWWQCCTK